MTIPIGVESYNVDSKPVLARGIQYNLKEYDVIINRVIPIIDDAEGKDILSSTLAPLALTGFSQANLSRLLTEKTDHEDWKIGEAIAEAYLIDHHNCVYPWPGGRDLKNPKSSPAGCDLVGFHYMNNSVRFSFGEVKTSFEEKYPPNVMTSRHGLSEQLSDLKSSPVVKDALVKYLGFHAVNASWRSDYETAAGRYLSDDGDVSLYGFLIRDVISDEKDLRARAKALAKDCSKNTSIELRALYMPSGKIKCFSSDVAKVAR
ncbi:hypothetical protein HP570_25145 [Brevibacillus sp. RS1.1]|uniref:hypothetical protein n=1 Tax=Brevibacillus sp. RS1.1 TaxID=2738982 RepID=UPI00156B443F|nr:hypothetical protein [Brevibacillus sp. RS1.1]NRR05505.1 hypothetical protein [Brevibacillus sp. RS1.1]